MNNDSGVAGRCGVDKTNVSPLMNNDSGVAGRCGVGKPNVSPLMNNDLGVVLIKPTSITS